ncbi:uncharacterized protein LOC116614675 isoform X2 [Nematostella vectensis]|uniref:uncharacterized protein LOC116614675 isoform X2 n=1 Tax=Nematostella vectensis TaxID=45351 RepID=UPI0020777530|nr:uncharacterized protein LOC116614675 isoform X2 [Nematostella vectensis]
MLCPAEQLEANDEDALANWNPMAEDYTNAAFNAYAVPTIAELKKHIPRKGNLTSLEDQPQCRSEDGDVRLFINGIPTSMTQEGLRGLFDKIGEVVYCRVVRPREADQQTTFGFVGFSSYREAEHAIRKFDGFDLGQGLRLRVQLSKKRKSDGLDRIFPDNIPLIGHSDVAGEATSEEWELPSQPTLRKLTVEELDRITAEGEKAAQAFGQADQQVAPLPQFQVPGKADQQVAPQTKAQPEVEKPAENKMPCTNCGKLGGKKCTACKIPYCSRKCQQQHWPQHKTTCTWKISTTYTPEAHSTETSTQNVSQHNGHIDSTISTKGNDQLCQSDTSGASTPSAPILVNGFQESSPRTSDSQSDQKPWSSEIQTPGSYNGAVNWDEMEISNIDKFADLLGIPVPPDEDKPGLPSITDAQSPVQGSLNSQNAISPVTTPTAPVEREEGSRSPDHALCSNRSPVSSPLAHTTPTSTVPREHLKNASPSQIVEEPVSLVHDVPTEDRHSPVKSFGGNSPVSRVKEEIPRALIPSPNTAPNMLTSPSSDTPFSEDNFEEHRMSSPQVRESTCLSQPQVPSTQQQKAITGSPLLSQRVSPHQFSVSPSHGTKAASPPMTSYSSTGVHSKSPLASSHYDLEGTVLQPMKSPSQVLQTPPKSPVSVPQRCSPANLQQRGPAENIDQLPRPKPYKRFYAKDTPYEGTPNGPFGIIATEVESPTLFYVQVCEEEATKRVQQLFFALQQYQGSPYDNYVPSAGELCIAQFTEDNSWYRAKVIYIGNNGLFRVLYVDFGNSEDIEANRLRRITEDLAHIPIQALKCSLDFKDPKLTAREWTAEAISTFKTLIVGKRREAEVRSQTGVMTRLEIFNIDGLAKLSEFFCDESFAVKAVPEKDGTTNKTQKDGATEEFTLTTNTEKVLTLPPTQASAQLLEASPQPREELSESLALDIPLEGESAIEYYLRQQPADDHSQQSNVEEQAMAATHNRKVNQESSTHDHHMPRDVRETRSPLTSTSADSWLALNPAFEVLIMHASSPWKFFAKKMDPKLDADLENLEKELGNHCNTTPNQPDLKLVPDQPCAAFVNNSWHRAKATGLPSAGYNVYLVDKGMTYVVKNDCIRDMPAKFLSMSPLIMKCKLAFVRKPKTSNKWSPEAKNRFVELVLNKKFLCREITDVYGSHIVDLLGDGEESGAVAKVLISEGLADQYTKDVPFKKQQVSSVVAANMNALSTPGIPVEGSLVKVITTEVISPSHFYVHVCDHKTQQDLHDLTTKMNAHYNTAPPSTHWQPHVDELCAASTKGTWSRCIVENVMPGRAAKVFFVDYGNTEMVGLPALQPLAEQFTTLRYCAVKASLPYLTWNEGTDWSSKAIELFKAKLPLSCPVNANVIKKGKVIVFLEVIDSTSQRFSPVSLLLVEQNVAKCTLTGGVDAYRRRFLSNTSRSSQSTTKSPDTKTRPTAITSARLPHLKKHFTGLVTEIMNPGEFYIQLADLQSAQKLVALSSDMDKHYKSTNHVEFTPEVKTVCAAKYSESGEWYRAIVETRNPDRTAGIFYVDFGNRETLPLTSLQPLKEQFSHLPHYAYRCSLAHVRPLDDASWSDEAVKVFKDKVPLNSQLDIKILYKNPEFLVVDLYVDKEQVGRTLQEAGLVGFFKKGREAPTKPKDPKFDIQRTAVDSAVLPPPKEEFDAIVTEIISPACFYIQTGVELLKQLDVLSADLNNHYNSVGYPSYQPCEFSMCVAPFGSSTDWFRGFVESVTPNCTARVYFVDFGNTADVPISQLRPIDDRFSALPYCALKCSLAYISPVGSDGWSEEAVSLLKSAIPLEKVLKMKLVSKKEDGLIVCVSTEGDNVSNLLIKGGLAGDITSGKLISRGDDIKSPREKISKRGSSKNHEVLKGSFSSAGYGKEGVSSGAQHQQGADVPKQATNETPNRHPEIKPQEQHLGGEGLQRPTNRHEAVDATQHASSEVQVYNTVENPHTKFQATVITPEIAKSAPVSIAANKPFIRPSQDQQVMPPLISGIQAMCETSPKEQAIASANLPAVGETFQLIVTDMNTPSDFSIQIADLEMARSLAELTRNMEFHYTSTQYPPFYAVPGMICAAQFTLNNKWYRGYIESCDGGIQIYYPDYGNTEIIDVSRLRPLEQNFLSLRFSALKCALSDMDEQEQCGWTQDTVQHFRSSIPLYCVLNASIARKEKDHLVIDVVVEGRGSVSELLRSNYAKRQIVQVIDSDAHLPLKLNNSSSHSSLDNIPNTGQLSMGKTLKTQVPLDIPTENLVLSRLPSGDLAPRDFPSRNQVPVHVTQPQAPTQVAVPVPYRPVLISAVPQVSLPSQEFFSVLVSDINSSGVLSLQIITVENVRGLLKMSDDLNTHCGNVDHEVYHPNVGEMCCALFSEDGCWYRAVVDQVLPDSQRQVTFVDFGNQGVSAPQCLRRIPDMFLNLPRQALSCTLTGLNPGEILDEKITNHLQVRALNQQLLARVVSSGESGLCVELFEDNNSSPGAHINKECVDLLPNIQLKPVVVFPQQSSFEVTVCEVRNPSEIWVQQTETLPALATLMAEIASYCDGKPTGLPGPPAQGDFCLAKFSFDDTWYRAKVLHCDSSFSITVQYIDYGNSETLMLDRVMEPPSQFLQLPPQALPCYLPGLDWGEAASEWIQQIENRQLILKVIERRDDAIGVELEDHGVEGGPVNIGEFLIDFGYATKKGYI